MDSVLGSIPPTTPRSANVGGRHRMPHPRKPLVSAKNERRGTIADDAVSKLHTAWASVTPAPLGSTPMRPRHPKSATRWRTCRRG
jgi:hypothetical protein